MEDLIKRLRNCISDTVEDCAGCQYQGGYKGTYCIQRGRTIDEILERERKNGNLSA